MNILLRTCLLALLALAVASPAAARSHKLLIKPQQLLPENASKTNGRSSAFVYGIGAAWTKYYYPLNIPAGKLITGLSFKLDADGSTSAKVELLRSNPGQTPAVHTVFEALGDAPVASDDFVTIIGTNPAGETRKVLSGWQYCVRASIENALGSLTDIVVSYRDP